MLHITVNSLSDAHCPDQFFRIGKFPATPPPLPLPVVLIALLSSFRSSPLLSSLFVHLLSSPLSYHPPPFFIFISLNTCPPPSGRTFRVSWYFPFFQSLSSFVASSVQYLSQLNPDSLLIDSVRSGSICDSIPFPRDSLRFAWPLEFP